MAQQNQDDPVFTRPEEYGIENLEAPGEPDRAHQAPSTPVPGVGREAGKEHRREHDLRGATPPDRNIRDRDAREARQERLEAVEEEREALDAQRE